MRLQYLNACLQHCLSNVWTLSLRSYLELAQVARIGDKGELDAGGKGANEVLGEDTGPESRGGDEVQQQGEAGSFALQLLHCCSVPC